jgi:hypothetical protein
MILGLSIKVESMIGYHEIRLDDPKFSTTFHGLYRSKGDQIIPNTQDNQIAEHYAQALVHLELFLRKYRR